MSVPESGVYPVRFQIPPGTLRELDHHEKVRRAERFAMASLLYEILSGTKPFEELTALYARLIKRMSILFDRIMQRRKSLY